LTFLATAEHAQIHGAHNPCGLFAALIHRQLWHYVTDSDEDAAAARLKHYLYGTPVRAAPPPILAPPELSRDAAIVRYLQTQLARAGWHGETLFGLMNREDPAWTRERWDRATTEVEHAEAIWQQANALNRLGALTGGGDGVHFLGATVADGDEVE
jgi:hypothetical protein